MNEKLKKILQYAVSAILAVTLLYFSFRNVHWHDFWLGVKSCRWGFVLLSMAFGVLSFYFRALRWRRLLLPIDPATKIKDTFNAVNISYVVNMVLPRVGEVVRCGYITKHSSADEDGYKRATFDKVLGTAIADRIWDAVTLSVLLVLMALLLWGRFGEFLSDDVINPISSNRNLIWIIAGTVIFIAAAFFLIFKLRDRNRLCAGIWKVIGGVGQGLASSFHLERSWIFLSWNILVWCMYLMTCATVLWALQGMDTSAMSAEMAAAFGKINDLNMVDALFLMAVGAISSLVPVPGGFGAFHYLVSLALTAVYGIPTEIGIIFATISHESQMITQIICGGLSYTFEVTRR